jgi:hypothetical protein
MEETEDCEHDELAESKFRYNVLIDTLHAAHMDNARLLYYARGPMNRQFSQMPLTPFIYEFFLFNSLYQIDWIASQKDLALIIHPNDKSEVWKQGRFVKFLRDHARLKPNFLCRAFEPIRDIKQLDSSWTKVKADSRISDADGIRFFINIHEIQEFLNSDFQTGRPVISKIRPDLDKCVEYINKVRNNIFHGSKTLGDSTDPNQNQRIEVYETFLKGLTSLFFLAVGKDQAACDVIPCAVNINLQAPIGNRVEISREQILNWTSRELLKVGDSRLIARFLERVTSSNSMNDANSAMFYPSAGNDLLTPLLLALPYCSQFYFYARGLRASKPPAIQHALREIASPITDSEKLKWIDEAGGWVMKCIIGGIKRSIHWCNSENTDFLNENVDLIFYFHRGDSLGEGGSGQKWDSELLPKLLMKVPKGETCLFVTDGVPGGLSEGYSSETFELNLPFVERKRTYHCGRFISLQCA